MLPLDEDTVVFSEAAQRLVGLNASAEFVFRKFQDGASDSDIADCLVAQGLASSKDAAHWVSATRDALGLHGLLADEPTGIATAQLVPDADLLDERLAALMPPFTPFEVVAERRYRLLDTVALIRFSRMRQVAWVDSVIGHLTTDDETRPTMTL